MARASAPRSCRGTPALPAGQDGSRALGSALQPAVIYAALGQLMRFVPGDS